MKQPLQITSRSVELTPAIEGAIRERAERLERFFQPIIACRVVVETPHRHQHKGHQHNVRLDITVPGEEIVVRREPREDLYVAIRDAFDAARRRLKARGRKQRNHHIHGEAPMAVPAWVSDLEPEAGFGFITTSEGRELYFESGAVRGDRFAHLTLGSPVRVTEGEGAGGPAARRVEPLAG
jgi:ribosomal subunit interface protein